MQNLNLNQFAQEVHQNAVDHGWWDGERSVGTVRALMHCELSEAVEAARSGLPNYYHKCPHDVATCETRNVHESNKFACSGCTPANRKPEGVCVELIDFCIRAMDYLAHEQWLFHPSHETPDKLIRFALEDFEDDECQDTAHADIGEVADILHVLVSLDRILGDRMAIIDAIGIAFAWVKAQGFDPQQLMLEKHAYNLTRPYKHGGKVF